MILTPGEPPQVREVSAGLCYSCTLPATTEPRWAWLADTHLAADPAAEKFGLRPAEQLDRAVARILAARPCAVVVNGDLAWSSGQAGDYQRLADALRPMAATMPIVLGVGNHDRREVLLAVMAGGGEPAPERLLAVVDQPPYRFVMLDSQGAPGEVGGELGAAQFDWLDRTLQAEPHRKTFLFAHHPGESISEGCRDFDALVRIVRRRPQVQAIVTGHEHFFSLERTGGVHLIGLPAVGCPLVPDTPCGWIEARPLPEALELAFHSTGPPNRHWLGWRER